METSFSGKVKTIQRFAISLITFYIFLKQSPKIVNLPPLPPWYNVGRGSRHNIVFGGEGGDQTFIGKRCIVLAVLEKGTSGNIGS